MNSKKWSILSLSLTLTLLLACMLLTGVVDPFFHYHAPLDALEYPLNNQRYQNDGIAKNFPYDALITGTSLTENFKPSEMDALFGTQSIKVCFSGGTNGELISNLKRALEANPHIRYVLYGIDEWHLVSERDLIEVDGELPTYLYDSNPINDVEYLLNKDILFSNTLEVFHYTASGQKTTSFDDFGSWHLPTTPEKLIENYDRPEKSESPQPFTYDDAVLLTDNIRGGLVQLAQENPQVQFYCFFPPYSILNWDMHHREGTLPHQVQQFLLASEILLEAPNIHLYSFYTDYETITNLENYRDIVHYYADINSLLLQRMHEGAYLLTKENYQTHWQEVLDFYSSYDYDSLFSGQEAQS